MRRKLGGPPTSPWPRLQIGIHSHIQIAAVVRCFSAFPGSILALELVHEAGLLLG
jgi:hypothetical protein